MEVDLATLVDDIKIKDVFGVNFDGIHSQELEDLIEEIDVNLYLQFKQTSSGLMAGNDVAIYLQIPDDWYRGPTEQFQVHNLDYKFMDVSLKNEDSKLIKIGIQLTEEELTNYRKFIIEYRDVFT